MCVILLNIGSGVTGVLNIMIFLYLCSLNRVTSVNYLQVQELSNIMLNPSSEYFVSFHIVLSVLKHLYDSSVAISLLRFLICSLNSIIFSFKSLKIFVVASLMFLPVIPALESSLDLFLLSSFFLIIGHTGVPIPSPQHFTCVTLGRLTSIRVFPLISTRNNSSYIVRLSKGSNVVMYVESLAHSRYLI